MPGLVPNHLTTVKKYQSTPSYHTLNPQNHQKITPKIKKPHQKWRGREKESGGEREKGEKECGIPQEKEKMRFKEG